MIRHPALRWLPAPDAIEHRWEPERVCVIVSDDTPFARALREGLAARAWRVTRVSPAALQHEPEAVIERAGPIAAWIDVAPERRAPTDPRVVPQTVGARLLGDASEEQWLATVFRSARALSRALHDPGASRAWFFAITRLDGALGLAPAPGATSVLCAGVYGLLKTLRLEWPSVSCRAIDLHPGLDAATAAARVIGELHDPDATLGEVAHSPDGRFTIEARDG